MYIVVFKGPLYDDCWWLSDVYQWFSMVSNSFFLVTNGDYYYRSMRPALKKILGWDQVLEDFFKIILIFTIIFMLTSANKNHSKIIYAPVTR